MSNFQTNILPFSILVDEVGLSFSVSEKAGYFRVYKKSLPKNTPSEFIKALKDFAWWSLSPTEGDITISINLLENKQFAKHYFNKILFDHFLSQSVLTNRNFIRDTEVYLEDTLSSNNDYKKYLGFSLRFDDNDLIEGTSLLVSYLGSTFILNRSAEVARLDNSFIGKVKYQGRIVRFTDLEKDQQADKGNIFPILNRDIRKFLSIETERNYSENKYKKYFEEIQKFYNEHLKDVTIGGCVKIFESGFYKPYDERVYQTSDDSNVLLFGDNQKHFVPYTGMKEYGPIHVLDSKKPVKFIFIFHKDDKEYANKVYSYLRKGYKSFPGLESFVNIRFEIDTERTIRFTSTNPIEEIKSALQKTSFDDDTAYAVLYISRIKRDTEDEEEDEVYYKLKELLLSYKITSQVIFKENIDNPSFNFFLPNIAIALLAKLGGIPWRLYRPIKNDLVVGVGADHSITAKNRFIGNAFCFQNDGRFRNFNAFEKGDAQSLANSIKEAIELYIQENKGAERLVIHYYKKMRREEEEPILAVLRHLNLSLPCVIITVNESRDYVLFDSSFDGKMPQSGTFIKTKWNEFLLCNNTRYAKGTGTRIESFPLPIKIKIQSSNYEKIKDINVVRELIDQVYQFSRMYWKSVRQRSMPVTIEYSELVAKMIAHFDNKELEPFARNSLWFL